MKVLNIIKKTKDKYFIKFSNNVVCLLTKSEISKYKIKLNEEVKNEDYDNIMNVVLYNKAIKYCNFLFKNCDKTEFQVKEKLKKFTYPNVVINKIVKYLKEHKYIDDERFCKNYIDIHILKKGSRIVYNNLLKKGISKEIIDNSFKNIDENIEIQNIQREIFKKWKKKKQPSYDEANKIKSYILRKGYSYDIINKAYSLYFKDS